MNLHGQQIIGSSTSSETTATKRATNPATGEALPTEFYQANLDEVDRAMQLAESAFDSYRSKSPEQIAHFLETIGEEIMALGDALLERGNLETALPIARLTGERGRTVGQLNLFARLIREGSWVDARIDHAQPDREPLAKPDVRRMLVAIGPVVVFGASNFPLAFSVAGGDTASALAAGCPVVVKAHSAHPGTAELVARAIQTAVEKCQMPAGVFSMLHGSGREIGIALVKHPATKAVGFTGSLAGGRALYDAAASRPSPIPVYAEMSSINPVFLLPSALQERGEQLAAGFIQSLNLGVGQFCTNPGLVLGLAGEGLEGFVQQTGKLAEDSPPGTMLTAGVCKSYQDALGRTRKIAEIEEVGRSAEKVDAEKAQAECVVFKTSAANLLQQEELTEEMFGPASLIVECTSLEEMMQVAESLEGHLTATLHGTPEELQEYAPLVRVLERKVGRILINGFPTGVEVCASMNHGGPYPATSDSHFTSVGTGAILRFARPVCYQDFPPSALPAALQDDNPLGIMRTVDDQLTRD